MMISGFLIEKMVLVDAFGWPAWILEEMDEHVFFIHKQQAEAYCKEKSTKTIQYGYREAIDTID